MKEHKFLKVVHINDSQLMPHVIDELVNERSYLFKEASIAQ